MERLERLAERLRAVDPVMPSPGAKIRGWNLVLAAVEQSATVRSRTHPVRRLVLAAVAAAVLLVAGAVAASADSLPDSALYPLKGVMENVRGALAFSPSEKLAYHLDLARTRLTEAEAMIARHRLHHTHNRNRPARSTNPRSHRDADPSTRFAQFGRRVARRGG